MGLLMSVYHSGRAKSTEHPSAQRTLDVRHWPLRLGRRSGDHLRGSRSRRARYGVSELGPRQRRATFGAGVPPLRLELAVVEYISWFNHDRLRETLGDVPSAEFESLTFRDRGTTPSGSYLSTVPEQAE